MNAGFTKKQDGGVSIPRSMAAGALAGCLGATFASPFYMVGVLTLNSVLGISNVHVCARLLGLRI